MPAMNVIINLPDGRRVPINCQPSDSIGKVKQKLQTGKAKLKVRKDERLYYGDCLWPLEENYTLKDYGISKGEVLDLRGKGKSRANIHIERTFRENVTVTSKETDPYWKIEAKIKEKACLQPVTNIINPIVSPTGEVKATVESVVRFSLDVDLDFTMGKVKELIQLSEGFPPDRYALYYHGKELQDPSQTLKGLGVKKDEKLQLSFLPKKTVITVKSRRAGYQTAPDSADWVCHLEVYPKNTVECLKETLKDRAQIPVSAQKLLFCDEFLDDNSTLADCGLQHGSILLLFVQPWDEKINLVVKTVTGKKIRVSARLSETVFELMEKIQHKDGIPVDQQLFVFTGKQLEESKTLWWYRVKDGDTITLALKLRGS